MNSFKKKLKIKSQNSPPLTIYLEILVLPLLVLIALIIPLH